MSVERPLSSSQHEILEKWADTISQTPSGSTFSLQEEDKRAVIGDKTDAFLENPSSEAFKEMWGIGYSASRVVAPTPIPEKWEDEGRSIEELADLIREIVESDTYDSSWEDALSAPRSTREFFGWHHAESQPILNAHSINALEFFEVPSRDIQESSFEEKRAGWEAFRDIYEDVVGHATAGTDWEVPVNVEIYLLCVCVDSAGQEINEEENERFRSLFRTILNAKQNGGVSLDDIAEGDVDYYWVNQHNPPEIEEEYLRAKTDGLWHHNLAKLSVGDVVFHNFDNELVGVSTVTEPAETYTLRGEEYYRVEVDLRSFGKPVPVDDDLKQNLGREEHRTEKYYPIDKNSNLNEAYLANLSRSAAEFLVGRVDSIESPGTTGGTSGTPRRIWQITPERGGSYWDAWVQHGIASIGFGLDHKVTDDVEEIDDVDQLSEEELVEIAADAGDNHGRGMAYRFQYELEKGDVIIAKRGRRSDSEPDVVYGIGIVTADHHEESYSSIDHTSVVGVDWKVTFGQDGVDVSVNSETDSIKAYTLDTLDPEYYRELASELAIEADADRDELLDLVFDGSSSGEDTGPAEGGTNYFWISANPSIWKVESIEDGGEVFYTAYNRKGNKRRIFGAFEDAAPGDKVLFYESQPVQAIVAEGTIAEGLHEGEHDEYDEPVEGITIEYSRPIEDITWTQLTAVPDLEEASPIVNRAQGSLFRLTAEEYETILALEEPDDSIVGEEFETLREKLDPITVDFELPDNLYFEDASELRSEIEASLNSGKHIIFTGPPGTGKTKLAKEICRQCARDLPQVDDHTFTTATSEWTAFDTIGGYVPSTSTEESRDELTFQPRLFLNCFRREQEGIVNNWLVIDEINRSDIDKAFGQLFSVLSGDSVELPYERQNQVEIVSVERNASDDDLRRISSNPDVFPVTPSWRLLATMNTYDKASLYGMSYAFMRRFNFVHVGIPDLETDDGAIRASLLDPDGNDNYATAWLDEDSELEPTLEEIYRELAVIWKVVNDYPRSIGPSIVRDILGYVDAYGVADDPSRKDEALTAAIVGMVYPQLEGLRPDKQRNLVREFAGERETNRDSVSLDLNEERLKAKAADYFDISFDDE
jgi:MoxR-like ATPase